MRLGPAGVPLLNLGRRAFRASGPLAAGSGLALLLAAGCGGSASPGGAVSSTVVIAAVPGVSDAGLYLAQKDGLFTAEGLSNVQIKTYSSQTDELNALRSGQADIAASDYGNVFYAQHQSNDLRILADGYDASAGVLEILTLPGSPVHSPADLVKPNVKVGMPSDNVISPLQKSSTNLVYSLDQAAATDVLFDYVGNANTSVNWVPERQKQEITDLKDHKLQAILVGEPYIYQAESKLGAVEVLDACSGATAGLPLMGYVAMSSWVRDNPGAVADFQAAIAKAQTQASLAGRVQAVLPNATGITSQVADLITVGTYPTTTSIQGLNQVALLMANHLMGFNQTSALPVKPMIVSSK